MLASLFLMKTKASAANSGGHSRIQPVTVEPGSSPVRKLERGLTKKRFDEKLREEVDQGRADVEKYRKANSKQVDTLVVSMRTNAANMRARLADAEEINVELKASEGVLLQAMGNTQQSASVLHTFNEEMEGDFALMKKKDEWNVVIDKFLSAALGQNPDVEVSTLALSTFLAECLEEGAPDCSPKTTSVVGFHPSDGSMLKVFHSSEAATLKAGANMRELRENKSSDTSTWVWNVLKTGEPRLMNAHHIARDRGEQSVMPLKTTSNETFGAVVTGPPPVPDELLERMCRQAGPLLERVWKLERVRLAANNVCSFIKRFMQEQHQLVYAIFTEGATVKRANLKEDPWAWMPFGYQPNSSNKVEVELKWRMGDTIGSIVVTPGSFTKMDEQLTVLLHVMADVLLAAVDAIEDLTPGDASPLATVMACLDEYERARSDAPMVIQKEVQQTMLHFDHQKVMSEIASFDKKCVDDQMCKILTGVLCLLGSSRKSVKDWTDIQKAFKKSSSLYEKMITLKFADAAMTKDMDKRWAEVKAVLGNIDVSAAAENGSCPTSVVILIRWFEAVHLTNKIALAIAAESKPPPANPIADAIFDEIDADKNGTLSSKELTAYLLGHFPTKVAHTMLRVLDQDMSKSIDREEWRRGWADGLLTDILIQENKKEENKKEEGGRMNRRRGNDILSLNVAAAAELHNKAVEHKITEKEKKQPAGKKKK